MLDNSFSAVQKVSIGGSLRRLNPYTKIRIMHLTPTSQGSSLTIIPKMLFRSVTSSTIGSPLNFIPSRRIYNYGSQNPLPR